MCYLLNKLLFSKLWLWKLLLLAYQTKETMGTGESDIARDPVSLMSCV